MVEIKILGTAQDGGIPHFGCSCTACTKANKDPKLGRNVASIAIIGDQKILLVDATPDIIQQQFFLKTLYPDKNIGFDAVLITHLHMGHYNGLVQFGKESSNTQNFPILSSSENSEFELSRQDEKLEFDPLVSVVYDVRSRKVDNTCSYLEF